MCLWIRSKYGVIEVGTRLRAKKSKFIKTVWSFRSIENGKKNTKLLLLANSLELLTIYLPCGLSLHMRVCCGKFHGHEWFFEMKFSTYIIFLQFFICCRRLDTFTFENKVVQPNPLCILCKKCFVVHNNNESTMGIIALDKQLTLVKKLLRCFFFTFEKKTDQTKSSEKKEQWRRGVWVFFYFYTPHYAFSTIIPWGIPLSNYFEEQTPV